jgi:hypothetical protein
MQSETESHLTTPIPYPIQIPLLQCTTKPLKYDTFSFGGDDELGFYHKCLDKNGPLFLEYLEIVRAYSKTEDPNKMRELEERHTALKERTIHHVNGANRKDEHTKKVMEIINKRMVNEQLRNQIIEALGGEEFCRSIPIIEPNYLDDYLDFNLEDIPEGHTMAQYEDKAGRKGCLIKLKNKETGKLDIVWIFQRYRETCLAHECFWMMNGACNLEGVDRIVEFLSKISFKPHPKFELAG